MDVKNMGLGLLSLLIFSNIAWGNGFHSPYTDTASLGQATGGITRYESSTTAQDLPAAMTFLKKGYHVLAGVTHASPRFTFEGEHGKGSTKAESATGLFVSTVKNFGDTAVGISQSFPFNSVLDWGEDFVGRRVISKVDLSIGNTSPVIARRFGKFALGAGIDFYEGSVNLQRVALTVNDDNEVRTELGGTGSAIGYNASFFFNEKQWSLGIQYHSPATLQTSEAAVRFDTSDELTVQLTPRFPDGKLKADLHLPGVTRLGLAMKDRDQDPNFMVEWTITHTGWLNYRELRFDFEKEVAGSKSSVTPKDWHDTVSMVLSGNYVFNRQGNNNMRVRGGIYSEPSPIPQETLDGVTPDTSRLGYALGYGVKRDRLFVEIAFLTVTFPEGTSTLSELPGKYQGSARVISASLGYHW